MASHDVLLTNTADVLLTNTADVLWLILKLSAYGEHEIYIIMLWGGGDLGEGPFSHSRFYTGKDNGRSAALQVLRLFVARGVVMSQLYCGHVGIAE